MLKMPIESHFTIGSGPQMLMTYSLGEQCSRFPNCNETDGKLQRVTSFCSIGLVITSGKHVSVQQFFLHNKQYTGSWNLTQLPAVLVLCDANWVQRDYLIARLGFFSDYFLFFFVLFISPHPREDPLPGICTLSGRVFWISSRSVEIILENQSLSPNKNCIISRCCTSESKNHIGKKAWQGIHPGFKTQSRNHTERPE